MSDSLTLSARDSEVFAIEHRLKLQRFSHTIEALHYVSGAGLLVCTRDSSVIEMTHKYLLEIVII